ncbi:MAG: FadR/GntR family transcriptional regulator [Nakamurella sp.]
MPLTSGRTAPLRSARPNRADRVQEQIKQLILDRNLASGDSMPTELELVSELDISRNSVREALKALQAIGIVEIRHGFGMYVGRISLGGLVDELTFHQRIRVAAGANEMDSLIQIREILECGLLERLITDHPRPDLTAVAATIDQMAADAETGPVQPATDKMFHEQLYSSLQNPLVGPFLGAFWDVYHRLQGELGAASDSPSETVRRHRDIYQAVLGADLPAAIAAMRRHFDGVRDRLPRQSC